MAMTRQDRVNLHTKQDKILILDGAPLAADLKEGVPILRKTKEGLVEYVKHENILYKNVMKLAAKADVTPPAVSTETITIDPSDGIIIQSTSANGYAKFGAGLIIQWGSKAYTGNVTTQTMPIAFPNTFLQVIGNGRDASWGTSHTVDKSGLDTVILYKDNTSSRTASWIAIGN